MDIESFLRSLNEHEVRYVVIGAMAFPHHGYARASLDVAVFIEPTPENATRALDAMAAFGFDTSDLVVDDLLQYKVLVRHCVVQVDLHPFVAGAELDSTWRRSEEADVGGVPARVPCLDDLIAMKEAAGRPKDLEDLKYLRALRARRG